MALSSIDETDLLMPLYAGVSEARRFATFLERLRRRTQSIYAGLIFRQGDLPMHEATEMFAGIDLRAETRRADLQDIFSFDRIPYDQLRPGRTYAISEFTDHDEAFKALRKTYAARVGIVDERIVRITVGDGISAWLLIAASHECTARDSALLSALAPHIAIALGNFLTAERQRIRTAVSSEGLARAGAGWIVFDREARVLEIDDNLADWLHRATGTAPRVGERIRGLTVATERELTAAAAAFAADHAHPVRALPLTAAPRIDALLRPAEALPSAARSLPVMLAVCSLPPMPSGDRAPRLAELYSLPRREAELAVALSDGQSIAEAAEAMGLTLETARNYSKKLYSRLGVRGQAELVRLVLTPLSPFG